MKKYTILLLIFLFLGLNIFGETIEKIIIKGNRKVSKDAVLFYMKAKEGSLLVKESLLNDFKTLWSTGFFENIKFETSKGAKGTNLLITLKENPVISKLDFKTGKKIKEKDITEKLTENNISLMAHSYFNPVKIKKVEKIITDMLLEKGFNDGKVNIVTKELKNSVELSITVTEGKKTKIGNIVFPGTEGKLSEIYLRKGMKNNQKHGLVGIFSSKDVYNKEKISEDLEEVKLRLKTKGYLEAKIGKPELSLFSKRTIWPFSGKRKMLKITIPVQLGPQYSIGNISVEGNKVIKTAFLQSVAESKLKKNMIYNLEKRNKLIEDIRKLYGSLGYFYCQVIPEENLDPVKKLADLKLKIVENDVVYLGKLEFTGNTFTKDYVIRREWFLREGKRLNSNLLEDCIRRMKQLGIVSIDEMPEIKPDPEDPNKINITAKVKEINRQMVNFNVGYSGYEGWFVAAGYQTQNFLGQGETLGINVQKGSRATNYSLSFTEPYFLNSPVSLGASIFKSTYEYPLMYSQKSEGFTTSASVRMWRYWGLSLAYTYQKVKIFDVNEDWRSSYYYPIYEGKRLVSSLAPTLYYSTVDSPMFPTSGFKALVNYRYSGGFLGGEVNLHKLKFELVKFVPMVKRHVFGFRAVYQYQKAFGGKTIPLYEKFYLGGEQNIRGYDIYDIGPRYAYTGGIKGGDKAFFMNFEYRIPFNEQFSFAFFYDVGNAYEDEQNIDLKNLYSSIGGEFKIFVPMLNVPFRLIFAYNPRKLTQGDSKFVFRFAVGPSFY